MRPCIVMVSRALAIVSVVPVVSVGAVLSSCILEHNPAFMSVAMSAGGSRGGIVDGDGDDGTAGPGLTTMTDGATQGQATSLNSNGGHTSTTTWSSSTGSGQTGGSTATGAASSYADVVLADAPLGYWRFGDTVAPWVSNEVATGVDGTYLNGVVLGVPGAIANDPDTAAQFDGVDDRVELGDAFDFPALDPFTLEAWIRPDIIDEQYIGVFSKEFDDAEGRQGYGLTLNYGTLRFIRNRGSNNWDLVTGGNVEIGVFSHVVVTFDGFTILLYLDGQNVGSGSGGQQVLDHERTFMVGARGLYNGIDEFTGAIDEVAIYDYPLPPSRIVAHYDAGVGAL